MKATMVRYERVFNLGNYENARIGIELELNDGETAAEGIVQAKRFVDAQNPSSDLRLSRARNILADRDNFTVRDVREAEEIINAHTVDFPF